MKRFLMKKTILAVLIFLIFPSLAAATGGETPTETQITYTTAQTVSLPFVFEPIDYSNPSGPELGITIFDINMINLIGSIALTFYEILGGAGIFGIGMVLILAVSVVFWLWSVVSETPRTVSLNVSGAVDVSSDVYMGQLNSQESAELARLPGEGTRGELAEGRRIRSSYQGRRRAVGQFKKLTRNVKRLR